VSVLSWFIWLSKSPVGEVMQKSTWGFAVVEIVHLLALAALGGTVLIMDLKLLGVIFKHQQVSRIARDLNPIFLGSLVFMVLSGVMLVSEEALKCYYNPAFRLKMLLLFLAIVFYFTLHRKALRISQDHPSWGSRAAAAISLALWLSIGLAGRAIGLI